MTWYSILIFNSKKYPYRVTYLFLVQNIAILLRLVKKETNVVTEILAPKRDGFVIMAKMIFVSFRDGLLNAIPFKNSLVKLYTQNLFPFSLWTKTKKCISPSYSKMIEKNLQILEYLSIFLCHISPLFNFDD